MSQVSILLCQFDIRICGSEYFVGRDAELGSENSGKIAQIAVAHGIGCLGNIVLSSAQKNFGQLKPVVAQVIQGGVSVNLFKTPVELASAHSRRYGKVCYVWRINRILAQTFGSVAYPFDIVGINTVLPQGRAGPGPDLLQLVGHKFQGLYLFTGGGIYSYSTCRI